MIFLTIIILTVSITLVLIHYSLEIVTVSGYSMFPTISPDDRLVLLRYWPAKRFRKGQIIVGDFKRVSHYRSKLLLAPSGSMADEVTPVDAHEHVAGFYTSAAAQKSELMFELYGSRFVKRIIGLPGDEVRIHISSIHSELQLRLHNQCDPDGYLVWHIPANYCFVRGDAPASGDSVIWGPVPLKSIIGPILTKLPSNTLPNED